MWSFGNNEVGQLGRTTVKNKDGVEVDSATSVPLHTPVRIRYFTDEFFRAVKVAAGSCIAAALSDRGELRVWGAYYVSHSVKHLHPVPASDTSARPPYLVPSKQRRG